MIAVAVNDMVEENVVLPHTDGNVDDDEHVAVEDAPHEHHAGGHPRKCRIRKDLIRKPCFFGCHL